MHYLPQRLDLLVSQAVGQPTRIQISLRQKPFLGKPRPSQLVAGKDGNTNPDQSCHYCKDTGHLLENCLRLDARNKYIAEWEKKEKEGLN